jgi:hypothetical protein
MTRPPGDVRRRIWALLDDGRPHRREQIVAVVSSHVPHAQALRYREAHMRWQRLRKRYVRQQEYPGDRRAFEIGAREIINQHLQSMVKIGRVERVGDAFRLVGPGAHPPIRLAPVEEGLSTEERHALVDLARMVRR